MKNTTSPSLGSNSGVKLLVVALLVISACLLPTPGARRSASAQEVVVSATVFLNPLTVSASTPSEVRVKKIFTVQAVVGNEGNLSMRGAVAVISLPVNAKLAGSKEEIDLGTIRAHEQAVATWRIKITSIGNYVFLTSASATYGAIAVADADTVIVYCLS